MQGQQKTFIIPKLCRNSSVLISVIAAQLVALIVAIVSEQGQLMTRLGAVSLYMQWWVMSSIALLCLFRDRINGLHESKAILICFALCFCCFMITEVIAQNILALTLFGGFDWIRFSENGLAAAIAILFVMRLFSIMSILEQRTKAETEMTIQALQARIKPHFLFNSLNTISELVHNDAEQAEKAIDSLALLFRASLESDKKFQSLKAELSLCKRYVELERWRLGERLNIKWNIHTKRTSPWKVPKLILQPLIENAILHGVTADGTIHIEVDVRETKNDISLLIENTKGVQPVVKEGNGIAVDNIRERLFVLYDDQQTFRIKEADDKYSVIMRFPKRADEGQE